MDLIGVVLLEIVGISIHGGNRLGFGRNRTLLWQARSRSILGRFGQTRVQILPTPREVYEGPDEKIL